MAQIACIGEVMIELAPAREPGCKALSYAGDTYNTAVTLARLGARADYVTRLGDDHYSEAIVERLQAEGVGTDAIIHQEGQVPGLYMIHNHPDGEREFLYWRSNAPARALFASEDETAALEDTLAGTDWVYLSGITLAIMSESGHEHLLAFLRRFKERGGRVAFDSNYRPRLWASPDEARRANRALLEVTDLALLTLDDETLLWGEDGDGIKPQQARARALGIDEVVLKRGAEDVVILKGEDVQRYPVPTVTDVLDTTAAGDTFNAGYLAARLAGKDSLTAAAQGSRAAGVVIRHRGGVIDRSVFMDGMAD